MKSVHFIRREAEAPERHGFPGSSKTLMSPLSTIGSLDKPGQSLDHRPHPTPPGGSRDSRNDSEPAGGPAMRPWAWTTRPTRLSPLSFVPTGRPSLESGEDDGCLLLAGTHPGACSHGAVVPAPRLNPRECWTRRYLPNISDCPTRTVAPGTSRECPWGGALLTDTSSGGPGT